MEYADRPVARYWFWPASFAVRPDATLIPSPVSIRQRRYSESGRREDYPPASHTT
jgi:hypothetical protein